MFDSLCWFEWLVNKKTMEKESRNVTEQFFLLDEFVKSIDIVFAFTVKPEKSIEREYANLLTDKLGTIMNLDVLGEYLDAIHNMIEKKRDFFHAVIEIDTSSKTQDDVGKEVTEKTLETLKDLLMERVGFLQKPETELIKKLFSDKSSIPFSDIQNELEIKISFDSRDKVEENGEVIQPIPIAVIRNKDEGKFLIIKKSKNAVSADDPEKDKELIYVGGHPRYEDQTASNKEDFLSICKTTLKREIDEEIGISIALDGIQPFCIYTPSTPTSKKHMAICFIVDVDKSIKLRLDPHELVLNKGTSKSGKFVSIDDISSCSLENWSTTILNDILGINIIKPKELQMSIPLKN